MAGLFQGLEAGKSALLAHQLYLQTIGNNIANVNTPGYTRQRVNISQNYTVATSVGYIGSGVKVTDIIQIKDLFLGEQLRRSNKSLGQWSYKEKVLTQVETLFNEPADNTLSDHLNEFWDAWDSLSQNPESTTNRKAVLSSANTMINSFNDLSEQLWRLRDSINMDLASMSDNINEYATEIANLNEQIRIREVDGSSANDLRDARNLLVDKLSEFIDVNTIESSNGELRVMVGAMEIVNGSEINRISTNVTNEKGRMSHELVWEGTDIQITNINGQLKGLVDTRDELIPKYIEELDTLARSVIEEVNKIHRSGYGLDGTTGLDFFDTNYLTAGTIRLNNTIELSPDKIAASGGGERGDGTIALAIQNIRNERVMLNDSSTINDYYNSIVGNLGVETNEAISLSENYGLVVQQVQNSKESIEGVSLDEEMANMIKFQHAYDAAARVITTMDEALDTVISRMGIVGR
ncbi:MAG: flagellar hook-associated protein FlgK [bacterium]